MSNLLSLPERLYDSVVLEPGDRWERSGQMGEVVVKQDENGRDVIAPIFDVGIDTIEDLGSREFGDKHGPSGEVHSYNFHLNDGMDRFAQLWLPYNIQAGHTGTSGMAYTTMVKGYDQDRAELQAMLGIPNIQISAEQGDKYFIEGLGDLKKLAQTALLAPEISIAKSSQAEIEIIAWLVEKYGLPKLIEMHGDSRGGKTSFGRAAYGGLKLDDETPMYDLTPLWVDPKAIVLHDRLPADKFYKVAKWLGKEAIVGSGVIASLARDRKLLSLKGTVSLSPNFVLASAVGIGPALLSGETGKLVEMLPDDMMGFANGYVGDELYDQENWEPALRKYPNLYRNDVDKAVHAHLLSLRGVMRQMGRFERLAEQSLEHGANLSAYDVPYIADRTVEQFLAQKQQQLTLAA